MFERDKDELRSAGIPLETREYLIDGVEKALGYELAARDFYLPYLRLVGQESAATEARASRGQRSRRRAGDGAEDHR